MKADDSTQQAVASSRGQPADRGTDADVLIAKWSQELIPHTHEVSDRSYLFSQVASVWF